MQHICPEEPNVATTIVIGVTTDHVRFQPLIRVPADATLRCTTINACHHMSLPVAKENRPYHTTTTTQKHDTARQTSPLPTRNTWMVLECKQMLSTHLATIRFIFRQPPVPKSRPCQTQASPTTSVYHVTPTSTNQLPSRNRQTKQEASVDDPAGIANLDPA
jgi:hypothetical protein